MKNLALLSVILVVITSAAFSCYKGSVLAANQSEGVTSQNGDLCGSTGGNGQIVSIGNNTFTLKLNEGDNLIVNLSSQATIETTTGYVSVSDLKIGDRVTLVGDNNRNGTFTADAVVVCSGTGVSGTGVNRANRRTPIAVRNENPEAYEKVSSTITTITILFVGLIWLSISTFLLLKEKKSLIYLLLFTVFYIYLFKVLDYTLLQFQSLLLLQHFVPNLILNGFRDGTNVNLIPLATLTREDIKTSFLNILMMLPFGFGLPFITHFRIKKVVISGLLLSIAIESLQFITGFVANTTFRVADVNDLIFNTVGVAIGYILFAGFMHIYRHIFRK